MVMQHENQVAEKLTGKIQQVLEECGIQEEYDSRVVASNIYQIAQGICPRCGADYIVWEETFAEEHRCP